MDKAQQKQGKSELNDLNDRQVSKSTNFEYLCDFPGTKPHVDYDLILGA